MNRISATHAARNFSDIVNRVRYQGTSFEIERGNEVIARIVPALTPSVLSIAELDARWAQLPRLESEDAALFGENLNEIRQNTQLSESFTSSGSSHSADSLQPALSTGNLAG